MPTIVITGGHHNSALVVAQDLIKQGAKVLWYGQTRASRGDTNDSAEYLEVKASEIPFYPLHAGKFDSTPTVAELRNIPLGFFRALKLLRSHRPDAVLSFGGYLGLTTALPARLLGIPVYLHEQTMVMGKANRLTALFARTVFLTWPSTSPSLPRTRVVGLPLRSSVVTAKPRRLFPNKLQNMLVMGGKRGSHSINQAIFRALPTILTHYNLVHQTGTNSVTGDYQAAISAKRSLPPTLALRYQPVGYVGEDEIGTLLRSADLYLGRSGAHISYELLVCQLRAVLIPFMHTTGNEQLRQSQYLASLDQALILSEQELSDQQLLDQIKVGLSLTPHTPPSLPLDANHQIVSTILADLTR